MNLEPINAYEYIYTPMDRTYPIRSVTVVVYAKTKEEADRIVENYAHEIFNQNCYRVSRTFSEGGFKVANDNHSPSTKRV